MAAPIPGRPFLFCILGSLTAAIYTRMYQNKDPRCFSLATHTHSEFSANTKLLSIFPFS